MVELLVVPLPVSSCCESDVPQRGTTASSGGPCRASRARALLEEVPDVLDVGVGEGVVVVVPVHPHAEPHRLLGDHLGELGDALAARLGERGEAVLLDVALGVQAERLLDLDLDPEALAVEAVLVALVVPAHRLVALEDVL